MNINAYVSDKIYLRFSKKFEEDNFIDYLINKNTYSNPQYDLLRRLRKRRIGIPKRIELWGKWEEKDQCILTFPRGELYEFEKFLQKFPYVNIKWKNQTICPSLNLSSIKDPWDKLDNFQQRAITKLLKYEYGCLEAPTGSGKTNILLSMIYYLETPTLILVHRQELLDQTIERCKEWLGVEAGRIGGGKLDIKPITVAMMQTLTNFDLSFIAKDFGAVITDECHHSPCASWKTILDQMPARYRYGFTATAWRKDRLEFLIWKNIGPIRWKITQKAAIAAGRIMKPIIKTIETEFKVPMTDISQWTKVISALSLDMARNKLIENTIRKHVEKGGKTKALILTDRVHHALILDEMLKDYNPALLVGTMDNKKRKKMMEKVKSGITLTIATTHLLGEGIDVPGWDMLFLVSPLARSPRVLQAIGRIARTATGKTNATLFDFLDIEMPLLMRAAEGRKSLYGEEN